MGLTWRDEAACLDVGTEAFFSDDRGVQELAKSICAGCPVRNVCLADALESPADEDWGIRGGLTRHARKQVRRSSG